MRTLLTQSLAVLMPFTVQELTDSTGNYYGINILWNLAFVSAGSWAMAAGILLQCMARFQKK